MSSVFVLTKSGAFRRLNFSCRLSCCEKRRPRRRGFWQERAAAFQAEFRASTAGSRQSCPNRKGRARFQALQCKALRKALLDLCRSKLLLDAASFRGGAQQAGTRPRLRNCARSARRTLQRLQHRNSLSQFHSLGLAA